MSTSTSTSTSTKTHRTIRIRRIVVATTLALGLGGAAASIGHLGGDAAVPTKPTTTTVKINTFDGVSGESTSKDHKGEIELLS